MSSEPPCKRSQTKCFKPLHGIDRRARGLGSSKRMQLAGELASNESWTNSPSETEPLKPPPKPPTPRPHLISCRVPRLVGSFPCKAAAPQLPGGCAAIGTLVPQAASSQLPAGSVAGGVSSCKAASIQLLGGPPVGAKSVAPSWQWRR